MKLITAGRTGPRPVDLTCVEPPPQAPDTGFRSATVDSAPFRTITGRHSEVSLSEGVRRTVAALPTSVHGKART